MSECCSWNQLLRAEIAVVRPRQDPLGWKADRSAAGVYAPL